MTRLLVIKEGQGTEINRNELTILLRCAFEISTDLVCRNNTFGT